MDIEDLFIFMNFYVIIFYIHINNWCDHINKGSLIHVTPSNLRDSFLLLIDKDKEDND